MSFPITENLTSYMGPLTAERLMSLRSLSTAGRLVAALKMKIPGLTGQASGTSLRRMENWNRELKLFSGAIEKNCVVSEKAMDLLRLASSSMEIQIRSYKRLLKDSLLPRNSLVCFSSDIKEEDLTKVKEDWEEEGVVCPHCKIGFTNAKALEAHIDLTGRGGGIGGCKVLWKKMNEEDVDAGKLPHVCKHDGCGIGFRWKSELDKHKAVHSDDRPYSCNQCGLSYKLQRDLNKHVRRKHSGQVFECPECEKQFNSKGEVKQHLKFCRQEEKEFKCNQCGLKCHTNSDLTKHVKAVHNKDLPHKCELCDYTCSTKKNLKTHMSIVHEKARPHQCEDCDAAFSTVGNLNDHRIRHHTFDWPHTCHVCEERGVKKGYIAPGQLKKHMEAKHPVEYQQQLEREKPAVCPHCEKRFKNEKQVKLHVKKGDIKEDSLEVRIYEVEVYLTSCLSLLQAPSLTD